MRYITLGGLSKLDDLGFESKREILFPRNNGLNGLMVQMV